MNTSGASFLPLWDDNDLTSNISRERGMQSSFASSIKIGLGLEGNPLALKTAVHTDTNNEKFSTLQFNKNSNHNNNNSNHSNNNNNNIRSSIDEYNLQGKWTSDAFSKIVESIKYTQIYMNRIEDSVSREADLSPKIIDFKSCLPYHYQRRDILSCSDHRENDQSMLLGQVSVELVVKELLLLERSVNDMRSAAIDCMFSISKMVDARKTTYLSQLKKMREVSNMATRNALQSERGQAAASLKQQHDNLQSTFSIRMDELQTSLSRKNEELVDLQSRLLDAQTQVSEWMARDKDRETLQRIAVSDALLSQEKQLERQMEEMRKQMELQIDRMTSETQLQNETNNKLFQSRLELQQQHELEMRDIFSMDRNRLEEECSKLREQVVTISSQLTSEQEKHILRLNDERDRHERDLRQSQTESLRIQTKLKTDLQGFLQKIRLEENKREDDVDLRMTKMRDNLLIRHKQEIEKLQETHQTHIRRIRAEIEVQQRDGEVKSRHLHEQEVRRLVRENDKLKKLLVRNGGNKLFTTTLQKEEEEESPPPPTQQPSRLDWGSLRDSLLLQDKKDPLPSMFPLDQSQSFSSTTGVDNNVSSNASRIGQYMLQLEEYLQGGGGGGKEKSLTSLSDLAYSLPNNNNNDEEEEEEEEELFGDNIVLNMSSEMSSLH